MIESDEKPYTYLSHTDDVIVSYDNKLRILSVSPNIEKVLGYKPEEMIGKTILDLNLMQPPDLDKAFSNALKMLSGKTLHPSIYQFITKDGTKKFGEVSGVPFVRDGKVEAVVTVARDITAQTDEELKNHRDLLNELAKERITKRTQAMEHLNLEIQECMRSDETLAEDIERYRIHFSLANDIMFSYDEHFRILSMSPNVERILGYKSDELVNKRFSEVSVLHPDSLYEAFNNAQRVLSGETIYSSIYRFITKDGANKFGEVSGLPLKRDDAVVGVISVARDVTELMRTQEEIKKHRDHLEVLVKKRTNKLTKANEMLEQEIKEHLQTEKALLASEEKYRVLVDNANEAIFLIQDGKFRFINPKASEISGYSEAELLTKPFSDFIHPEDRDVVMDRHKRRMSGEDIPGVYSFRGFHKDGSIKWVEINSVILSWEGKPAVLTFLMDITERKQMDQELKKHQDHLEALVKERTSDLVKAIEWLKQEVEVRKKSEDSLREREIELEDRRRDLEEMNTTLKVMLKQRDKDKADIETNIMKNINETVMVYLDKLKISGLKENQMGYLAEAELHLKSITSSFVKELSSEYFGLSPKEIQVASLIEEGKSSKEIADLLNVSLNTVIFHRHNIRRKTGLKKKKVNLTTYLKTLKHGNN